MFSNDIALTVIVTTLLILLLIAGVIITIFLANKRHIQQDVKITQMELNYEKELRSVQHEVQEQVLTNIARELHDNIGQLLTSMSLQVEIAKLDNPTLSTVFAPMHGTLNDVRQQVRLLSRSLNSDLLENGGLMGAIEQEVDRLKHFKHILFNWKNDETEPLLKKDQRIMTFRIFQEVLNNALKHSGAARIDITLTGREQFRILTVHDDGKGFDFNAMLLPGVGSGIKNMIKRARLADLDLHIDTNIGKGCTFTLSRLQS